MPSEEVRVVSRFLGGGFGCKGQLWWPWMFWAMLASRKTGRPVRLELTRAQMFTLVGRRQETVQDMALGFDRTGHLTAIAHHVLAQTSTHADYSDSTAVYSRVFYACPNVATSHKVDLAAIISSKFGLRCVVLHACLTSSLADRLAKHVEFVMGCDGSIDDDAAILFSKTFYHAISTGRNFPDSFTSAVAEVRMNASATEAAKYVLKRRDV